MEFEGGAYRMGWWWSLKADARKEGSDGPDARVFVR